MNIYQWFRAILILTKRSAGHEMNIQNIVYLGIIHKHTVSLSSLACTPTIGVPMLVVDVISTLYGSPTKYGVEPSLVTNRLTNP